MELVSLALSLGKVCVKGSTFSLIILAVSHFHHSKDPIDVINFETNIKDSIKA